MLVAQDLNFDVARVGDEFLDEDAVVTETGFRFRSRAREIFCNLAFAESDAHAFAAAAGGGFDHHRVADLLSHCDRLGVVGDDAEMSGNRRNLGARRGLFRFDLVAHRGNRRRIGSDENDTGFLQRLGESRTLGQKAVARMHRLCAALFTGGDDALDHEVALRGRRRPDRYRRVRHLHMQRVTVSVGIDRNRLDTHAPGGLDDPTSNFAAVGNQDALEHCGDFLGEPAPCLCGVDAEMSMRRANIETGAGKLNELGDRHGA